MDKAAIRRGIKSALDYAEDLQWAGIENVLKNMVDEARKALDDEGNDYPNRRTGQLIANLAYSISDGDNESAVGWWGVLGEETGIQFEGNDHAGGQHWEWLANRGWLGIDDLHFENAPRFQQWFSEGVEQARR